MCSSLNLVLARKGEREVELGDPVEVAMGVKVDQVVLDLPVVGLEVEVLQFK